MTYGVKWNHIVVVLLLTLNCVSTGYAQKRVLCLQDLKHWPSVNIGNLSPDGKYVWYMTVPSLKGNGMPTVHIQSSKGTWQQTFANASWSVACTPDSKQFIGQVGDSVFITQLGATSIRWLPGVSSWKILGEHLVYQEKAGSKNLVYVNIYRKNRQRSFTATAVYQLDKRTQSLFLLSKRVDAEQFLLRYAMEKGQTDTIWKGATIRSFLPDPRQDQVCFVVAVNGVQQLWLWSRAAGKEARMVWQTPSRDSNAIDQVSIKAFSENGEKLFINLQERLKLQKDDKKDIALVWNSSPKPVGPQNITRPSQEPSYLGVVNLDDGRFQRLQLLNDVSFQQSDQVLLMSHQTGEGNFLERKWNAHLKNSVHLITVTDGRRQELSFIDGPATLSPKGKFVLYFDSKTKQYFCYNTTTGVNKNLTEGLSTIWTADGNDDVDGEAGVEIANVKWCKEDKGIFIPDQNDIWWFDPFFQQPPVNLTNGLGKRKGLRFSLLVRRGQPVYTDRKVLFACFNPATKENGFYVKDLNTKGDPRCLSMGPYLYTAQYEQILDAGMIPVKAANAEVYLVKRSDAAQAPNFFLTQDFVSFRPVSQVYPEIEFNWLRSELVNYKGLDGRSLQGVLYKPENFDSSRKYPLIIHVYEKLSNNLHVHLFPSLSKGALNIPFMVSQGYLIFTPDIHYTIGYPGRSAFNAVVAAARTLEQRPYVDNGRMGLQGHSFGGFETNYVVTHSTLFAAACSAAGPVNLTSLYGSMDGPQSSSQGKIEVAQFRMNGSLWERKERYIDNSPIFNVDMVTTPMLLNYNSDDDAVPFTQGVEFISAFRRLGKKAWMLQYPNEGHTINDEKAATDFTVKMKEFFDHYLKGTPLPEWMKM